ncbi:MAG: serine/threonine protein kinase [Candidatus Sumerlaeaceae bacterium]|nr:serine/threonine protein kinase [Candidatus Sumerlaeaceae bacterium]
MSNQQNHDSPGGLNPEALLRAGMAPDSQGPEEPGTDPALLDPAVLTRDFPDFEIIELLGRGGMGVVYKARDRRLDRLIALKIMTEGLSQQSRFVERFEREGKTLARLNHPNIVTLYEFGRAGSRCFMVMEYVEGTNLRQVLRTGVSPKEALALVPQVCAALQYAHNAGIVHRDIKPENILINLKGEIKIADFGLAKLLPGNGAQGMPHGSVTVIGTPAYMAPEQIESPATVDHRADVYALGVVFYELLTGELPHGVYKPPSQQVAVDVRLDAVVLRALERKPEMRYQHVSELGDKVESIRHTPPPPSSHRRSPKWFWHALLLIAVVVAIVFFMKGGELIVHAPGSGGKTYPVVSGGADTEVAQLFERARILAATYDLNRDSIQPGTPFKMPDSKRLRDFPPGTWPRILGPIGIAGPQSLSPSQFKVLQADSPDLKSPRVEGLVAYRPRIDWSVLIGNDYATLLCLDGMGRQGVLNVQTYVLLIARGDFGGRVNLDSYATLIVDGRMPAEVQINSYANVVVTGDLTGSITCTSSSYAMVYVQGGFKGRAALSNSRFCLENYTPTSALAGFSGSGEVYLAESDLTTGTHTIGNIKFTVARQRPSGAP